MWRRGGLFPLHVPIAVMFSLLILAVGAAISLYHFDRTSKLLAEVHMRLFSAVAGHARDSLAHAAISVSNTFIQLGDSPLADSVGLPQRLAYLPQLAAILDSDPLMVAIAAGYGDGSYFQLRRADAAASERGGIPPGAVWEVCSLEASAGGVAAQLLYYDKHLRFLAFSRRAPDGYDPRTTAWYRSAAAGNRLIVTAPYLLHGVGEKGISVARRNGSVVLSIDIGLAAISRLLAGNLLSPSSRLELLDEEGWVLAASGGTAAGGGKAAPVLADAWHRYRREAGGGGLEISTPPWLVFMASVPSFGELSWTLGIAVPEEEIFAEAYRQRRDALIFTFVAVLLSFPIAWALSRLLTQPLHRLAAEAESVSALRFDTSRDTRSVILEVDQLSCAVALMKSTIARFLELGRSLGGAREVPEVLREVVAASREASSACWGAVAVSPDGGGATALVAPESWGADASGASIGAAVLGVFNEVSGIVQAAGGATSIAFRLPGGENIQLLGIPLATPQNENLGVLLLADWKSGTSGLGRAEVAGFLQALAGSAAMALQNQRLLKGRKELLHAVIRMVADAIDAKSPYTGRHCSRVPEIVHGLAIAVDAATDGPFAEFRLAESDWEALDIAAWLHDCGKLTTPEYVVDKATKLETLHNRIHEIRTRFEVLKRDAEIAYWRALVQGQEDEAALRSRRDAAWRQLDEDFAFVAGCNLGSATLSEADRGRLARIGRRTWQRTLDDRLGLSHDESARKAKTPPRPLPATEALLADRPEDILERDRSALQAAIPGMAMKVPEHLYNWGELYNLSIPSGTLTEEERFKINEHIVQTIAMLARLPYPPDLARVPEIAGGHHEAMDGSGYPRGLRGEQMSIQARMIAIADVFEALTAADRPYKDSLPMAEALAIMTRMCGERKLDANLFAVFLRRGVWQAHAKRHLPKEAADLDVGPYLAALAEIASRR